MPVSGLVLSLQPGSFAPSCPLAEALSEDERITIGEAQGSSLPVVTETETNRELETLWKELEARAEVLQVRLAFHDFSDLSEPPTSVGDGARSLTTGPEGGRQ